MAIHDSDPDRRNLVVTSLAFILFFLADGKFELGPIRLQVIPLTFGNTIVLEVFCWVLLVWFAIRYWQTHRSSYRDAYEKHIIEFNRESDKGAHYLEKQVGVPKFPNDKGFRENSYTWSQDNQLIIAYKLVNEFTEDRNGSFSIHSQTAKTAEVSGFLGLLIKAKYFLTFAIKTPGFSSYAVPYILFFCAIAAPLLKCAAAN